MDLGIKGRRALVTGASKGLGRGCAEAADASPSTRSTARATCTSSFDAARVPMVIRRSSLPRTRTLSEAASRSSTSISNS